jgi:transcriptional regulator with XRE-family HTH domain
MEDALATWHMGPVIDAYRRQPWHGQVISQSVVGRWFGLTQTQLSRIENGHAPEEISKLVRWARLLGIPPELLWFKLADGKDASAPVAASSIREAIGVAEESVPDRAELGSEARNGLVRRDFVLLAAAVTSFLDVLGGLPPELPERAALGSRVDGETVTGLENMLLSYRQGRPGPGECLQAPFVEV